MSEQTWSRHQWVALRHMCSDEMTEKEGLAYVLFSLKVVSLSRTLRKQSGKSKTRESLLTSWSVLFFFFLKGSVTKDSEGRGTI